MSIYELLNSQNILLPKLSALDISSLSSKRTLKAWLGVDTKEYYTLIFLRSAKARLLKKEADELSELSSLIATKQGHAIKKIVLFYHSQACSKAIKSLKELGWCCIKVDE